MRASSILRSLVLLIAMLGIRTSEASAASPPFRFGVSLQVFYNELSPYGDWVIDPEYGYVWVPFTGHGFQPYLTNGYWAMTEFGNTWVSNYAWGWAPFHYGRWFWDEFYGWAWVPGYEWGPAWVSWRTGAGFYGWAPLTPGFRVDFGYFAPMPQWVFIPQDRFLHAQFHNYCITNYHVDRIYHRTTIINNTNVYNNQTFYSGPSRREVERVTNSNVPVYTIRESSRPGRSVVQQDNLNMYRPEGKTVRNTRENSRPQRSFAPDENQDSERTGRSVSESRDFNRSTDLEDQRNSRREIIQDNGRDGLENNRGVENTRREVAPYDANQQRATTPRSGYSSQERSNTNIFDRPQSRNETSYPNSNRNVESRQQPARDETRTQPSYERQPAPASSSIRQPTIEQNRIVTPSPGVTTGTQSGERGQQRTEVNRSEPGAERSPSAPRGTRREN